MLPSHDSKRQLIFDQLTQAVKQERADDARWFAANPRRSIRIRKTYANEARRSAFLSVNPLPRAAKRFTLVKHLKPSGVVHLVFVAPQGFQPPLTEAGARRVWDLLCATGATIDGMPLALIEAAVESVLGKAA